MRRVRTVEPSGSQPSNSPSIVVLLIGTIKPTRMGLPARRAPAERGVVVVFAAVVAVLIKILSVYVYREGLFQRL
jgi:hypothetical protein